MRRTRHIERFCKLAVMAAAGLAISCASLTPYPRALESAAGRLIELDRGAVHIVEQGAGEPVILLHGFGASSYAWRVVAEQLADDYRTIAVDFYGFGLSARPREKAAYSAASQTELVLGVLDALGLDSAHLVGHSYGGAIAMTLAVRAPERFRSLTLVDAAAPTYPQTRRNFVAAPWPLVYLFVKARLTPHRVERGLRGSAADDSIVTPQLVDAYYQQVAIEGAPRAFWGLTAPLRGAPPAVAIADISLPTLVVWGAEDELIRVDPARKAAGQIPNSRFVVLDGIGHIPMEESPGALAGLMRRFLDQGLAGFDRG